MKNKKLNKNKLTLSEGVGNSYIDNTYDVSQKTETKILKDVWE